MKSRGYFARSTRVVTPDDRPISINRDILKLPYEKSEELFGSRPVSAKSHLEISNKVLSVLRSQTRSSLSKSRKIQDSQSPDNLISHLTSSKSEELFGSRPESAKSHAEISNRVPSASRYPTGSSLSRSRKVHDLQIPVNSASHLTPSQSDELFGSRPGSAKSLTEIAEFSPRAKTSPTKSQISRRVSSKNRNTSDFLRPSSSDSAAKSMSISRQASHDFLDYDSDQFENSCMINRKGFKLETYSMLHTFREYLK